MLDLVILIPVYDDWAAFARLVREIDRRAADLPARVRVRAIDDGSGEESSGLSVLVGELEHVDSVEVTRLVCNLGHQRAIAVGLVEVGASDDCDAVLVMDSDGEDRPEHVADLLAAHLERPEAIVVATRAKRSEGLIFKLFYVLYRFVFRLLTGRGISFGNFCLIPRRLLQRLVFMPEVWNSLASSVVRSKMPIVSVRTVRGTRYAGRSSMNFMSLLIHGLSMVSVYSDAVLVRMLLFSGLLSLGAVGGLLVVVFVRLFTDLAIPGWASTIAGFMVVIFLQALVMSVVAVFLLLSNRSSSVIVPALDAQRYVRERVTVAAR
jgi:polyisoprenyl-phosphate glycosyltransferase